MNAQAEVACTFYWAKEKAIRLMRPLPWLSLQATKMATVGSPSGGISILLGVRISKIAGDARLAMDTLSPTRPLGSNNASMLGSESGHPEAGRKARRE